MIIKKLKALDSHEIRAMVYIFLSLFLILPMAIGWNDSSRMATIQSVVESGTFIIDDTVFFELTWDKVFANDHFYPDKPLFPSVFGILAYWPLYQMGIELDVGLNAAYFWITFFSLKFFWVLGLKAFYDVLGYTDLNNNKFRVRITLALAFASLYFTYSSSFNNHIFAAAHMIMGLNFYLKAKYKEAIAKNLFLAGLFVSLAAVEEPSDALFYIGFFVLILLDIEMRKKAWVYLLPMFLTVLPTFMMYYRISGSILPFYINHSLYMYPGSNWENQPPNSLFYGFSLKDGWSIVLYYFNGLVGWNGFISYSPFLFIAIPSLVREIREKRKLWLEALMIGLVSLIIVIYYLSNNNHYGGSNYSVRWFVVLLPLFFVFLYQFFENFNKKKDFFFRSVFGLSLVISTIGLTNPWSYAYIHDSAIVSNIVNIVVFISKLF